MIASDCFVAHCLSGLPMYKAYTHHITPYIIIFTEGDCSCMHICELMNCIKIANHDIKYVLTLIKIHQNTIGKVYTHIFIVYMNIMLYQPYILCSKLFIFQYLKHLSIGRISFRTAPGSWRAWLHDIKRSHTWPSVGLQAND